MTKLTQQNIEDNTDLLIQASNQGDVDEVTRLIPISNPKAKNSWALRRAAANGHAHIVTLLLPISEPRQMDDQAMGLAVFNGHTSVIELFIPLLNPKKDYNTLNTLVQLAAEYGHSDILKLLIPLSDYQLVLQKYNKKRGIELLQQCIHEHEALQQKERLHNNLVTIDKNKTDPAKRKM